MVTLQTGDGAELRLETGFALAASETEPALAVLPAEFGTAAAEMLALVRGTLIPIHAPDQDTSTLGSRGR